MHDRFNGKSTNREPSVLPQSFFIIMQPLISSNQNPRLKSLVKLRDAKHRRQQGRFLIDGIREISHACRGGVAIEEIWFDIDRIDGTEFIETHLSPQQLVAVTLQPVTAEVLAKIEYGERSEGVVAVAKTPNLKLTNLILPVDPLIVVLDRVEKPGNIGAVCRTAAAANISALILSECLCDVFNPNAIRSSLGHLFSLPIAVASAAETISFLHQNKIAIKVARVQAEQHHWNTDLRSATAIVLGSEAAGLEKDWLSPALTGIKIPMDPRVDSLNVSVSAAILMYEAMRQRSG